MDLNIISFVLLIAGFFIGIITFFIGLKIVFSCSGYLKKAALSIQIVLGILVINYILLLLSSGGKITGQAIGFLKLIPDIDFYNQIISFILVLFLFLSAMSMSKTLKEASKGR